MENDSGTGKVRANWTTMRRKKNTLCMDPNMILQQCAIISRLKLIVEAKHERSGSCGGVEGVEHLEGLWGLW